MSTFLFSPVHSRFSCAVVCPPEYYCFSIKLSILQLSYAEKLKYNHTTQHHTHHTPHHTKCTTQSPQNHTTQSHHKITPHNHITQSHHTITHHTTPYNTTPHCTTNTNAVFCLLCVVPQDSC